MPSSTPSLTSALDRLWFSPLGRGVRRTAQQAADLLLPVACVGCGAEATDLCDECCVDFRLLTRDPFSAAEGAEALPITNVDEHGIHLLPVSSAGLYKTLVADVVIAFKDHERIGLGRVLAPALSRSVRTALQGVPPGADVLLVWPPSSPRARLRRGRSPVEELVRAAALPQRCRAQGPVLNRTRSGMLSLSGLRSQKGRAKSSRRAAVTQFELTEQARRAVSGQQVLLIDDVLTTGATIHGMYAALTEAGAFVRGAAVVAVTPRAGLQSE